MSLSWESVFPYCGISSIVKASIMSPLPMKRGFMGAPDSISLWQK